MRLADSCLNGREVINVLTAMEKKYRKRWINYGLKTDKFQSPGISFRKEDEKQPSLHHNHCNTTNEDRCRNRTHAPKGCQSDLRAEAHGLSPLTDCRFSPFKKWKKLGFRPLSRRVDYGFRQSGRGECELSPIIRLRIVLLSFL
jgi:hypothetical protein